MPQERKNATKTIRVQLSLDPLSTALLDRIAEYGSQGKNRSEVATRLMQDLLLTEGRKLIEDLEETSRIAEGKDKPDGDR